MGKMSANETRDLVRIFVRCGIVYTDTRIVSSLKDDMRYEENYRTEHLYIIQVEIY